VNAEALPVPAVGSDLPKSAAVVERFEKLYQRPVVLEVRGLGKRFESAERAFTALDSVSFRTHRRELMCFIGPSGCGKSTLARIIAGLEHPTSGQALLDGAEIRGPGHERGMVFQAYTLFPWRTVLGNVSFGLELAGESRHGAESEAQEWIELVGLSSFAGAYPHELSGGMKQRVAIARALAAHPRILLMDEPFGALDAQTRTQMQIYLLEIWKRVDITVLFVTHDLDEAIFLADRVVVMGANPGRVLEIVEVPVPRPRDPSQVTDPGFVATRRYLEGLIHEQHSLPPTALPRFRMTQVGDEVE